MNSRQRSLLVERVGSRVRARLPAARIIVEMADEKSYGEAEALMDAELATPDGLLRLALHRGAEVVFSYRQERR